MGPKVDRVMYRPPIGESLAIRWVVQDQWSFEALSELAARVDHVMIPHAEWEGLCELLAGEIVHQTDLDLEHRKLILRDG